MLHITRIVLVLLIFSHIQLVYGQSTFYSLDQGPNHLLDRLEVKSGSLSNMHLQIKPVQSTSIKAFLQKSNEDSSLTKTDRKNIKFLLSDTWDSNVDNDSTSFKKSTFFGGTGDLFAIKTKDYSIRINPVLNLKYGYSTGIGTFASKQMLNNTRGLEMQGTIGKRLSFYSSVAETITDNPSFLVDFFKQYDAYPYQGYIKIANDDVNKFKVDYFNSIAYINVKASKNLHLSFGHDRNFIGSGIRSLVMSDFSIPFLNFKTDLKLGRLHFFNLLGQMTDAQGGRPLASEYTFPPKFMAFHHINLNISKNINLGLFESVMFGKRDSGFELNYLNPLIFYRFIEGNLGSKDNAMVGVDFKVNLAKSYSFYGQFVLDEYNKKLYALDGSIGRKYAWQLGAKQFDFLGIKNLDIQAEINLVRPFTYAHFSSLSNNVNNNTAVGHPLGANFKETVFSIKYQPLTKVFFQSYLMNAYKGEDKDDINYGGNILRSYRDPKTVGELRNFTGQGFKNNIINLDALLSYRIYGNCYFDISYQSRSNSYLPFKKEQIIQSGIRWNHAHRQFLF